MSVEDDAQPSGETCPAGETCPEGFGAYELRPYFAATHYGTQPLPQNMARHMERCACCRERWQFLIDTDPKASKQYWEELEAISERVAATEAAPASASAPLADEAIVRLAESPSPDFAAVRDAWKTVKAMGADAERLIQAENLAAVSAKILDQRPAGRKALDDFMTAFQGPSPSIAIRSVEQMLFLATLASTSYIREYQVAKFDESGGVCDRNEFLQAEQLYRSRVNALLSTR